MTPAEAIQLARAAEQMAELEPRRLRRWERDSWEVRPAWPPRRVQRAPQKARACLAGDCSGRVVGWGYCRDHLAKVRAGVALDRDLRKPRGRR